VKPATSIFLTVSGLLLLVIGSTILLIPHTFYASDGIVLGNDPSLLSEIRAPGGLLVISGSLILIGVFRPTLRSLALMLTVLVYGSFGLSRLLSFYLDGMPSHGLMIAMVVELVVAGIGLVMLSRQPSVQPQLPTKVLEKRS